MRGSRPSYMPSQRLSIQLSSCAALPTPPFITTVVAFISASIEKGTKRKKPCRGAQTNEAPLLLYILAALGVTSAAMTASSVENTDIRSVCFSNISFAFWWADPYNARGTMQRSYYAIFSVWRLLALFSWTCGYQPCIGKIMFQQIQLRKWMFPFEWTFRCRPVPPVRTARLQISIPTFFPWRIHTWMPLWCNDTPNQFELYNIEISSCDWRSYIHGKTLSRAHIRAKCSIYPRVQILGCLATDQCSAIYNSVALLILR